jgi:hypothetical protein
VSFGLHFCLYSPLLLLLFYFLLKHIQPMSCLVSVQLSKFSQI